MSDIDQDKARWAQEWQTRALKNDLSELTDRYSSWIESLQKKTGAKDEPAKPVESSSTPSEPTASSAPADQQLNLVSRSQQQSTVPDSSSPQVISTPDASLVMGFPNQTQSLSLEPVEQLPGIGIVGKGMGFPSPSDQLGLQSVGKGKVPDFSSEQVNFGKGKGADFSGEQFNFGKGKGPDFSGDQFGLQSVGKGKGSDFSSDQFNFGKGKGPDFSSDQFSFGKGKSPDFSSAGKGKVPDFSSDQFNFGKGKGPDFSSEQFSVGKGKGPDISSDQFGVAKGKGKGPEFPNGQFSLGKGDGGMNPQLFQQGSFGKGFPSHDAVQGGLVPPAALGLAPAVVPVSMPLPPVVPAMPKPVRKLDGAPVDQFLLDAASVNRPSSAAFDKNMLAELAKTAKEAQEKEEEERRAQEELEKKLAPPPGPPPDKNYAHCAKCNLEWTVTYILSVGGCCTGCRGQFEYGQLPDQAIDDGDQADVGNHKGGWDQEAQPSQSSQSTRRKRSRWDPPDEEAPEISAPAVSAPASSASAGQPQDDSWGERRYRDRDREGNRRPEDRKDGDRRERRRRSRSKTPPHRWERLRRRSYSPPERTRRDPKDLERIKRQAGVPPKYEEPAEHKELLIPQRFTSRLIGKSGSKIAMIRQESKADITIRQGRPDEEYSKVVVVGTPQSVKVAEGLVWDVLGMEPGANIKEFDIPAEFVSAIIGPGGSNIQHMRKAAGGIQIGVKVPDAGSNEQHKVIIGPAQKHQLEIATNLVMERITAYRSECLTMLNAPGAKKMKEVPCKFNIAGQCKKGDLCPFSHEKSIDEFSGLAGSNQNPAKWKTVPCKFFEMGKCKKGDGCPFIHPKPGEWPEGSQPESNQSDSKQSGSGSWENYGSNSGNNQGGNQWTDYGGNAMPQPGPPQWPTPPEPGPPQWAEPGVTAWSSDPGFSTPAQSDRSAFAPILL